MQAPGSNPKGYSFGAFEVDLLAREVRKNGRRIKLQDQPFRVLALLLESHPNMVAREDCGSGYGMRIHSSSLTTA